MLVSMMLEKSQYSFNNNTYRKALHAAMYHISSRTHFLRKLSKDLHKRFRARDLLLYNVMMFLPLNYDLCL